MKKSSTPPIPIPITTSTSPNPIEQPSEERQLSGSIPKEISPMAKKLLESTSSNTEGNRLFRPSPVPAATSPDDQEGWIFRMDP